MFTSGLSLLFSLKCSVFSVAFKVFNVQCVVCSVQYAECSVQCTVCILHCAIFSVQRAVCSMHYTVCRSGSSLLGKLLAAPTSSSYYYEPLYTQVWTRSIVAVK